MAHTRSFWTSTLQDLFNGIKNTPMQDVLTPAIALWVLGSPGGLASPIFESVSGDFTFPSKWGCNTYTQQKTIDIKTIIYIRKFWILIYICCNFIEHDKKITCVSGLLALKFISICTKLHLIHLQQTHHVMNSSFTKNNLINQYMLPSLVIILL
jgi:hypothetical protein